MGKKQSANDNIAPIKNPNQNNKKKNEKKDKKEKNEDYVKYSFKESHMKKQNDEKTDNMTNYKYYDNFDNYTIRLEGVLGLKNLHNTCFMNSSLQCLSHIQSLYKNLKTDFIPKNSLANYFLEMLNLMHETKDLNEYNPSDILEKISNKFPKYKIRQQQDANEFITNFLSTLHEELNCKNIKTIKSFDISDKNLQNAFSDFYFYKENSSPIVDLFYGNFINMNKCRLGHITNFDFSVYNMLELSISKFKKDNIINLETLIQNYTQYGSLGIEEFCEKCNCNSPSFFGMEILNAPDILIIFINRVINNQYFNNLLDFPTNLYFKDYVLEDKNLNNNFELIGVINHTGSASFGHYTADCKNFIDNKWYYFNDSWISYSEYNKKKERNLSSTVLILFYKRFE